MGSLDSESDDRSTSPLTVHDQEGVGRSVSPLSPLAAQGGFGVAFGGGKSGSGGVGGSGGGARGGTTDTRSRASTHSHSHSNSAGWAPSVGQQVEVFDEQSGQWEVGSVTALRVRPPPSDAASVLSGEGRGATTERAACHCVVQLPDVQLSTDLSVPEPVYHAGKQS